MATHLTEQYHTRFLHSSAPASSLLEEGSQQRQRLALEERDQPFNVVEREEESVRPVAGGERDLQVVTLDGAREIELRRGDERKVDLPEAVCRGKRDASFGRPLHASKKSRGRAGAESPKGDVSYNGISTSMAALSEVGRDLLAPGTATREASAESCAAGHPAESLSIIDIRSVKTGRTEAPDPRQLSFSWCLDTSSPGKPTPRCSSRSRTSALLRASPVVGLLAGPRSALSSLCGVDGFRRSTRNSRSRSRSGSGVRKGHPRTRSSSSRSRRKHSMRSASSATGGMGGHRGVRRGGES